MLLIRHNINAVTRLINNQSYESVHARIKEVLRDTTGLSKLFAGPQRGANELLWYSEHGNTLKWKSFTTASDSAKEIIIEQLESLKAVILPKLQKDKELQAIAHTIFIIPSEASIFFRETDAGEMEVVLAQWACRAASGDRNIDPLEILLNRPKPNHTKVSIEIRYNNGSVAANTAFNFLYRGGVKNFKTDAEGIYSLGSMKIGAEFSIAEHGIDETQSQTFSVVRGQDLYEVVFPFRIKLTIDVVTDVGTPVSGAMLQFQYGDKEGEFIADDEGRITANLVWQNAAIALIQPNWETNRVTQPLNQKSESINFLWKEKKYYPVRVDVKENGIAQPNTPVWVSINQKPAKEYYTNQNGSIYFENQEPETTFTVTSNNKTHTASYTVVETENVFEFDIKLKPKEFVRIIALNHNDTPIQDADLEVVANEQTVAQKTDEKGATMFEKEMFVDKQKFAVSLSCKDADGKARKHKEKIVFDESRNEYIVKLKKRINLWWLLLFLLPLILLIPYEKNVSFKVLESNSNEPVANLQVDFSYTRYAIWADSQLFLNKEYSYSGVTDSVGFVAFKQLKTSIYSLVFKINSKVIIETPDSCYTFINNTPRFHFLSNKKAEILYVTPVEVPVDFTVIDRDDQEPIPDATFTYTYSLGGRNYSDTLITGTDGRVVVADIPLCATINAIIVSKKGYYNDTSKALPVSLLLTDTSSKRKTIALKPVKKKIVFFVKNCQNNEPIPGAEATITVGNLQNQGSAKVHKTNINGVGKGEYDDLHVLKEIVIDVRQKYFKPGKWDQNVTIEQFIQLPDSLRTICLEPEMLAANFENIDSLTREPLAGVRNIVKVKSGSSERIDTIISNRNGKFVVAQLQSGNTISIISSYEPNYEVNAHKIKSQKAEVLFEAPQTARVIPLKPKELELVFRTIDATLNALLPDVSLKVFVNGTLMNSPVNSGNGNFSIKAYSSAVITIEAEKTGFQKNDTKVSNKLVSVLNIAHQRERDIPMVIPPCNTSTLANDKNTTNYINQYSMGSHGKSFVFDYYTDSVADEINIYCGNAAQMSKANLIFHTYEATYNDWKSVLLNLNCNSRIITVEVKGSSKWEYKVNCP